MKMSGGEVREPSDVHLILKECVGDLKSNVLLRVVGSLVGGDMLVVDAHVVAEDLRELLPGIMHFAGCFAILFLGATQLICF